MRSHRRVGILPVIMVLGSALFLHPRGASGQAMEATEPSNEARWYMGVGPGLIKFEGDEVLQDAALVNAYLGYDCNERWTLEGVLSVAPSIDVEETGQSGPLDVDSTSAFGLALDGLFHFTRWERVDPYIAAGLGYVHYADELGQNDQDDLLMRGGGGVLYHFNDEWAVRADFRAMLAGFGESPNANSIISAGLNWNWGARIPPRLVAVEGPADSDGDGLTDLEERQLGTDPYDPDTDKDRLSDGDEVNTYHSNPLNPDTDMDMLKDGDEVYDYETNPILRDTDNGGVADGHEVLEDKTNPLDPKDDLVLYTLDIEFDTDKAVIKDQYFDDIDVIGKVLRRNPATTALIEGHADKRRTSSRRYNQKLSQRRAGAVLDYLATRDVVDRSRMRSVGHGFDRPKAPNDPVSGNRVNRRVEVYIRGITREQALESERDADVMTAPRLPEDK